MKVGEQRVVTIEKIVYGGEGLGKLEENMVVFVPFSAPGDKLRIVIQEIKKGYLRATLKEILEAGKGRINPPCPYYGLCGGCSYQHLDYETELSIKEDQLKEIFFGFLKEYPSLVEKIIPSPFPYGYRNRVSLHNRNGRVGFYARGSSRVIPIKSCLIASEQVNKLLAKKSYGSKNRFSGGIKHFSIREPSIPSTGFYQVNRFLLGKLKEVVSTLIGTDVPFIIEGYCGAGFFTEQLSKNAQLIYAIETNPKSLEEAKKLGLKNVFFIEGKIEDKIADCLLRLGSSKAAYLFDPPKEGLSKALILWLIDHPLSKLVYVSCNPLTLKRDILKLEKSYVLKKIVPVDLFPRTPEIESAAVLVPR
ncbi:class I SAM-dependent RNA methyltransferase [Methylacidiphilum caldifontis]|uniref:class I SAM-dependent RNA methyltransferase n=1 Tax=Methylacidiphilum caldifontis TaxID=2795386 RepID=UPI001A906EFE|nr:TRAM domain-containing protein [Methylacidiphilum caldifontis]QSR88139.1 class I SAM-dependent RNA methyltransferase [Methylacidiphilum caldifontis]